MKKTPLKRKCKICKEPALYLTSCNKAYCSAECGSEIAMMILAKRKESQAKAVRKDLRKRKAKLDDTVPIWIKKVQKVFNAYIRERDKDKPCISCDRVYVENTVGGQWDCGHYLSVGAFPELRFEPLNAHKQCKSCNGGSGKYTKKNSTVGKEYRKRLEKKLGVEKLEFLEGPHEPKRYRVEDLKELHEYWKDQLKRIKNA